MLISSSLPPALEHKPHVNTLKIMEQGGNASNEILYSLAMALYFMLSNSKNAASLSL